MPVSIDEPKFRIDDQCVAYLVENSRLKRGLILSGDKYLAPNTITSPWADAGSRTFTINGSQSETASITFAGLLNTSSKYIVDFTISSYSAGGLVIGNSDSASASIVANGNYEVTIKNIDDVNLLLSANSSFNGAITVNTIKSVRQ